MNLCYRRCGKDSHTYGALVRHTGFRIYSIVPRVVGRSSEVGIQCPLSLKRCNTLEPGSEIGLAAFEGELIFGGVAVE